LALFTLECSYGFALRWHRPADCFNGVIWKAWLLPILWMIAIFVGSTDLLASHRTSRVIGPVLRWFKPDISEAAIEQVQFVVRKCGHMAEYGVLALLLERALAVGPKESWVRPQPRRLLIALVLATTYAVTDELHQLFVATRYASGLDVLIDSAGAALALGLAWLWTNRTQAYDHRYPHPLL
jgi:VanZ family protein